jgi:DNA-binding NarL/FixJ family response regulator
MPIKVLLADDHSMVREGLRRLLAEDPEFNIVGEAADGSQALSLVKQLQPDVVLMDINMPVTDGIAATRQITEQWPHIPVIVLTMHRDDTHVLNAIQAGARGYVLKNASSAEVASAIRTVHKGGSAVDNMLMNAVLDGFRRGGSDKNAGEGIAGLTPSEVEALRMVANGGSNKEIAKEMDLALSTVKNKLTVIYGKIGVESRAQATAFAIRHGLATEEQD